MAVGQHVHRRFLSVPKLRMNKHRVENNFDGVNDADDGQIHEEHAGESEGQRPEVVDLEKISVKESDVELWLDAWVKAVRSAATLSRLNVLHVGSLYSH